MFWEVKLHIFSYDEAQDKQCSYNSYYLQVLRDASMTLYLQECSLLTGLRVSFLYQDGQCINW